MGHLVVYVLLFLLIHLHLLLLWQSLVEARMRIDLVSILLGLMVTSVQLKVSGRLLHRFQQCILEEVSLVYPLGLGLEL